MTYDERPYAGDLRGRWSRTRRSSTPRPHAGPRDEPKTGNIAGPRPNRNQRGDVEKGLAEAEVVDEATYYGPVHTHAPLETHGVIANWEGDQLTLYASTQGSSPCATASPRRSASTARTST